MFEIKSKCEFHPSKCELHQTQPNQLQLLFQLQVRVHHTINYGFEISYGFGSKVVDL